MSGHTDTLVAYVLYYGKVHESLSTAKMAAIDQNVGLLLSCSNDTTDVYLGQKMDLSYQLKNDPKWRDISIEFDPPLSCFEEVKPRLLSMKVTAEEGLGMVRIPSSDAS
jgi:Protein of unknown function (DUF2470)